jgi:hypothetical protein
MKERYTDQELIDRGLLELSPSGHLQTPMPSYKTGTMTRQKEIEQVVSHWECPTQLDRIESMLKEVLSHINKQKRRRNGSDTATDTAFNSFWSYYPRKTSKPAAVRAWNGLNQTQKQKIISVIPDWVDAWKGKDKQYIPHPSTWLNQHRFNDDVDIAVPEEKESAPKTEKEWTNKAFELGIKPRTGEQWHELKERIKVAMR